MSYIIDPEDLSDIRTDLGPQPEEGQVFLVVPGAKVRDGAGYKLGGESLTLLPARTSYQPYHRTKEEIQNGAVQSRLRYLVELPAFTAVSEKQDIDIAAPTWAAKSPVDKGEERISSTPDGWVYAATAKGVTGDDEPTWGDTVATDGSTGWNRSRNYLRIQVVEVAKVDPYEVTRNVWGDLKS